MTELASSNSDFSLLLHKSNDLPQPFAQEIFLLACHIAGTTHRALETVEPALQIGEIFCLRREPENEYDAKAIAIYNSTARHLGYVPRQKNEVLAHLLDAGKLLQARLTAKEWQTGYSGKNWLRLDVEIFMQEI